MKETRTKGREQTGRGRGSKKSERGEDREARGTRGRRGGLSERREGSGQGSMGRCREKANEEGGEKTERCELERVEREE